MKQGGTDEADELTRLRSEKAAGEFWRGVFSEITDKTEREKIEAELHDFHFIMEQVPQVYMHITGYKLSKCNYYAHSVIAEADERVSKEIEEALKEDREVNR